MTVKYRVGDVAKDLGVASKDIIALLAEFVDTPKKSVTTLTEEELNIVTTPIGMEIDAETPAEIDEQGKVCSVFVSVYDS